VIPQPDIRKLVDCRNEALWQHVKKHKAVNLQFHPHAYQVNIKGHDAIFLIKHNDYCMDSFTHELLHADISIKEVYIYGHLHRMFKGDVILSTIFCDDLLVHIGNVLEHVKMLPNYLNLGFDRAKFIDDYNNVKCTIKEANLIAVYFKSSGDLRRIGVDRYVGKYFAMRACPNNTIDYTDCLVKFNEIDPALFQILDKCWYTWLAHDIEHYDVIDNNYNDVLDDLYYGLINWVQLNLHSLT